MTVEEGWLGASSLPRVSVEPHGNSLQDQRRAEVLLDFPEELRSLASLPV